ncbi:Cof-type HAD-IIB family hydrolase [Gordonia sp. CPCC 205515]|uniref:Cof-type HAD-IIB family hydrolase n=1 Tax=Gordonia sp. CPCC 205515 TaxID=3140791 RepID=UPI003AF38540
MTIPIPPVPTDVRLIVTDMDGTLLDGAKQIPDSLWPLLDDLGDRGIVFSPASGRQAATLLHQLGHAVPGLVVIAENGSVVARDAETLHVAPLGRAVVDEVLARARELAATGTDLGVVLCAPDGSFVERSDDRFLEQVHPYYFANEVVDDLTTVDAEFVKVAIYDFGGIEGVTAPALMKLDGAMEVVVSGEHWLDVMAPGVDKAVAVRAVQERLDVTPAQTMVFGDYLNDLAMLGTADWSYAMANAHPRILEAARYVAPSNEENGVVRTVRAALGLPDLPAS